MFGCNELEPWPCVTSDRTWDQCRDVFKYHCPTLFVEISLGCTNYLSIVIVTIMSCVKPHLLLIVALASMLAYSCMLLIIIISLFLTCNTNKNNHKVNR